MALVKTLIYTQDFTWPIRRRFPPTHRGDNVIPTIPIYVSYAGSMPLSFDTNLTFDVSVRCGPH